MGITGSTIRFLPKPQPAIGERYHFQRLAANIVSTPKRFGLSSADALFLQQGQNHQQQQQKEKLQTSTTGAAGTLSSSPQQQQKQNPPLILSSQESNLSITAAAERRPLLQQQTLNSVVHSPEPSGAPQGEGGGEDEDCQLCRSLDCEIMYFIEPINRSNRIEPIHIIYSSAADIFFTH